MKKTLLSILAVAALFGTANVAKAEIANKDNAKAGEIYRWEANNPGEYEQLCKPENGVYGLFTYAADAQDWDSQFFWVFADANKPAGTVVHVKFQYRKTEGSGDVKFGAQGHANPHSYVNNDGWAALEATTEWKDFDEEITLTGEIRTFALNCSVGRSNGTLLFRNILIEVDYEPVIETEETTEDDADLGEAPVVVVPVPELNAEVPYDKIGGTTELGDAAFISREEHGRFAEKALDADSVERLCGGKQFFQSTVKYGDDNVFAFRVDTNDSKWGGSCLTQLIVKLESVSKTIVPGKQVVLSYTFKTDAINMTVGTFNLLSSYAGSRYGTGGTPTNEWQTKTDTVVVNDSVPFTQWEFHLGMAKAKINYDVFLKDVNVLVDGKVVLSSNDLTPVAGAEIKDIKKDDKTAVAEVAAINVYVAGDVLFASEAVDVTIFNINGVAVKAAKNVTSLNVSDLRSGLYIAKVGNKTVKFVK